MSNFSLENGMPQNLPAEEPLKTYNTKLENDWVWILVNK
jgi:3-phenylpropionate/trans-cinnamate dioxygenase ferredoxin component